MDTTFEEAVVLPGEDVTAHVSGTGSPSIRLGAGLLQGVTGSVVSTLAGVLCHLPPNRFYVLTNHRRYVPALGDTVVGVVRERMAEHYRVKVNGTSLGQLSHLAFDGATRRNKPDLAPGSVVFARVSTCSPHMEPELTCCAPPGVQKKDWVTKQGLFGPLSGGRLVHVSLGLARRLLNPSCALLTQFSKVCPYEMAVGLNGLVWVLAADEYLDALCAGIAGAEDLDEPSCTSLAQKLCKGLARRRRGGEEGERGEEVGGGGRGGVKRVKGGGEREEGEEKDEEGEEGVEGEEGEEEAG